MSCYNCIISILIVMIIIIIVMIIIINNAIITIVIIIIVIVIVIMSCAFQVSTIVWGFNKLRPQLPEYAAIYEAATVGKHISNKQPTNKQHNQ